MLFPSTIVFSKLSFQEQLKIALQEIIDVIKSPMLALKDAVKNVIEHIAKTLEKLKKDLIQIKNSVNNIGQILKFILKDLYKN